MNSYVCGNYTFAVLEFESVGDDYDGRVLWPAYVTNFNMSYWLDTYYQYNWFTNNTNTTNSTSNSTTTNTTTTTTTTTNTTNTTN